MKKLLALVLCTILALGSFSALTACGNKGHKHKFSGDWVSDDQNHWHICADCNEKGDETAHTIEVLAAKQATCTSKGLTEGKKCSVCGKVLVPQHETAMQKHDFNDWTKVEGETKHTRHCKNEGCKYSENEDCSFDRDMKCKVCGFQGELPSSEVSQEAWEAAFDALNDITNFELSITLEDEDYSSIEFAEVKQSVIHKFEMETYEDGEEQSKESYIVFTDDGAIEYEYMYGIWMPDEYYRWGTFEEAVAEILDNMSEFFTFIKDSYSEFAYNEQSGEYSTEQTEDDLVIIIKVRFDGNNIFTIDAIVTGDGVNEKLEFTVGMADFEVVPEHEHKYDDAWSSNNVYHWHGAVCHDDEWDAKVPHSYVDGICSVCGKKSGAVNNQVTKDVFEKAFSFKNMANWTYKITVEDEELITCKRNGGAIYMLMSESTSYIEIIGDKAYNYLEVSDGVWEKVEFDDEYFEMIELEINAFLYGLDVFANLFTEFKLTDGAYVANGLNFVFNSPFTDGREEFEDATATIVFDDGEVISLEFSGLIDGETYTIKVEFASTTFTLPDAKVHEHTWTEEIRDSYHLKYCNICGEYESEEHDYDDNDVCTVCGAKNHYHFYNLYRADESNVNYHYQVCECGVQDGYREEHDFDRNETCAWCGAKKHHHNWVVDKADYNEHSIRCSDCKTTQWEEHTFGENDNHCSVCGADKHEHDWDILDSYSRYHEARCKICGRWDDRHQWGADNRCTICNFERCIHEFGYPYFNNEYHEGYCAKCDTYIWGEAHLWNEDKTECAICGAEYHEHNYVLDTETFAYEHRYICEGCGNYKYEGHSFDDAEKCTVCKAAKHYHDWKFGGEEEDVDAEEHYMICEGCDGGRWEKHVFDKSGKCTVCKAPKHEHTWEVNQIEYNWHHLFCSDCGQSWSGTHNYVKGECSFCGAKDHDHVYTYYPNDVDYHYGKCECGVALGYREGHDFDENGVCIKCHAQKHVEHQLPSDCSRDEYAHWGYCKVCDIWVYEEHTYTDGVCEVCGYFEHEHTVSNWERVYHGHGGNCDICDMWFEEGHTYTDGVCDKCGYTEHDHTYSDEWVYDETYHWHMATCEHADLVKDKAEHIFGIDNKCNDCGYIEHNHTASNWERGSYWHGGYCDICDMWFEEDHTYTDGVCDKCGYERY